MKKLLLKNLILDDKISSILIENGTISAINENLTADDDTEVFDCRKKLAATLPFYNTHTHAAMTLLRSYAEDMELFDWLNNHIWPMEAKLTADDIYIGSRLAIVEMIRSGTVFFNDSYWHPEATLQAVKESGIRATIGMLYLSDKGIDNDEFLARAAEVPLANVSHAPHAIYTVDTEKLQKIAETSAKDGSQVHIHVAETATEVADSLKKYGKTPVAYLDSLGLINQRAALAHCVHLTDEDREIIAAKGAYILHNPVSNMKLCSGIFDFEKARKAGCKITIGTDGSSSNNSLSMLEEMKFAALCAKLTASSPLAGNKKDILRAARTTGAELAGVNAGIAPGKAADILLINTEHISMCAGYDMEADMIYSGDPQIIDSVICNGKFLKKNGIIPDEQEIIAEAQKRFMCLRSSAGA